ncbi:flagellar export chaperone FliS [Shewanella sp. SW32]|uniref:flagellar export chaperone FliS n=1 Tax=unclassified Shewanella TaxID=196818 RepID=UPI0021DA8A79|nr:MULTISPECIES: flagellar export chaperone FliS [unclassified Shewanella]MCU7961533.1 flagellar export chaperone FliS [Shewanella sp. SW32]MCU7969615.1 flagellar export chaperone FliS [Shewanella sp. SW29]
MRGSLQSYRKVSLESQIADASPHRITQMLFNGALERIAQSKIAMEQGDIANKGLLIGKAIGIILGLKNTLVMDAGGDIATNLANLYDFMVQRLTDANVQNDPVALDDVAGLLREIKEAWDAIPADKHNLSSHTEAS